MSILSNTPTLSYIYVKDMVITYNDVPYQISNTYTQKPYIYWSIDQPYELIVSNTMLKERAGLYYIIFNQKGIYTQVPQTDIEISFGEDTSRDLITEKILGFQAQNEQNEEKFTTIQADINGIKQTVGTVQEDVNGTKQTISEVNQKADNISASVSTLEREYAFDKELSALREDTNIVLLGLQSTLGIFSSDMNNFMEDNKLSDEESNQINAYKDTMTTKLNSLNTQIDKIIALLESQEKTEDVTRLTTQKQLLNDSINNLLANITTVCTDKVFTNTEITTVVNYFANANTKINETNNMIDELIFLEIGGALVEEISKLNISQNEIKLSVSKTEQTTTEINNKVSATVKSVNVMYYLSTSTTELIGGTWTDIAPTWEADKYMWSKTVTTLTNGIIRESSPTCIAGAKGQDGVPGTDGINGQTTYTWIKYADDENGNGISNDPTNKSYIGFAYNKTTNIESNLPSDYTWSLIKGADGVDGKDGLNGLNGTTYYTWIKYSDNANGSNMYDIPTDSTRYIGIATNKTTKTESTNPTEYTWSKFRGEDGTDGVPGTNGITYYTWIRYANDENGDGMSNSPIGKTYIGFAYNKTTSTESNNASDYKWSLIKGADGINGTDGTNGIDGVDGKDGITYYTWIKYSDNANGSNMYDTPNNNTKYIGIATNQTEQTESSDYTKYVWSKFRGEDGADGVPGKDGVTTYTWIKYADDSNGNGISNDPTGKEYIGFAYNKTTPVESNSPSDYIWSLIKGRDGVDGQNGKDGTSVTILGSYNSVEELNQAHPNNNNNGDGYIVNGDLYIWDGNSFIDVGQIKGEDGKNGVDGQDGKNGLNAYVHIKYSNDGGKTFTPSNGEEVGDYLGIYTDYYEADSTDVTKYTWSKIKGQDGVPGTNGKDGKTYYTWIKYSNNADGTGLYDTPNSQTKYIGIATNKTTATESTNKTDYVWSKFRGEDGTDGKGVTSIVNYYRTYTSDKGLTNESNGFSTNVPTMDSTNKYLWSYELITYTDNSSAKTSARVIGMYSTDGVDGTNGRGISSITEYYAVGTSNTTAPTNFSTKIPTMDSTNKYLWNYEVITYTDNTTKTTDKRVIGVYGETGATGTGIESITEEYYLSTSKTTQTGGSWVTTPPTWEYGKYIWTRSKIVYKDPASTVYTTPICDSSWEAVNEIDVGGRNYIYFGRGNNNKGMFSDAKWIITDDYAEATLSSTKTYVSIYIGNGFILNPRDYEIGAQYTWSYDFMITNWSMPTGTNIGEWWMGQRYTNGTSESSEGAWRPITQHNLPKVGENGVELNKWVHVTYTITIPEQAHSSIGTASSIQFYQSNADVTGSITFRIKNVKIEKGNKATDWTPAPEEIQTQIDFNKAEIKTTKETVADHTVSLNDITSRVSSTESTITTIQNKVNIAIKEVYTMYYLSTSSTQLIDGAWSRDIPSDISYNYLWTKTVTVYVNGTTSESNPICNTAMNGEDGEPGYTVILSDETFIVQCDLNGDPL